MFIMKTVIYLRFIKLNYGSIVCCYNFAIITTTLMLAVLWLKMNFPFNLCHSKTSQRTHSDSIFHIFVHTFVLVVVWIAFIRESKLLLYILLYLLSILIVQYDTIPMHIVCVYNVRFDTIHKYIYLFKTFTVYIITQISLYILQCSL